MAICVFCGTGIGVSPHYRDAAAAMGRTLAENGLGLVYGGGRVGLMGVLADAVLAHGGQVVGVMARALVEREIAHRKLSALHVVDTMHERKAKMAEFADGFAALPGGAGTLEEIFEQWTWAQLGVHGKPCGFLNVEGFFDPLRNMFERMVATGFMKPEYERMLVFEEDPARLLARFRAYAPPPPKWREVGRSSAVRP